MFSREDAKARSVFSSRLRAFAPSRDAIFSSRNVGRMLVYYWATTRDCVRTDVILDALRGAGFADVDRHVELGMFSEYTGIR